MRKGFTLIELLVVIAIIAILAAILFPVFMRARQMSWQTKCGSHGKELCTAMLMYLDDNCGRYPTNPTAAEVAPLGAITWRYRWPGDPRPGRDVWSAKGNVMGYLLLKKYVTNKDIWICPAPNGVHGLKYSKGYRCNWIFNNASRGSSPDTPFCDDNGIGRTISEVQALDMSNFGRYVPPAKKIWAWCYALGPDIARNIETYTGSGVMEQPLYPHNEGSIYVYCDGHAKWAETGCGWAPVGYTKAHIDRAHPRS